MGDLWHKDVPDDFICDVFYTMSRAPHHTFIVLTKRAQRMYEWFNRPAAQGSHWHQPLPNVIGMVTTENQEQADKRIPWLLKSPFAVRGVSVEPMLGPVDLQHIRVVGESLYHCQVCLGTGIYPGPTDDVFTTGELCPECSGWKALDWVICGAETGPGARPMSLDWARSLRDQCQSAGVPFFFKKDSDGNRTLDGRLWEQYPEG
jgi:protein gp37